MAKTNELDQVSGLLTTVENLLRKRLACEEHRASVAEQRSRTISAEAQTAKQALIEAEKTIAHLREQRDKAMDENKALRKQLSERAGA